MVIVFAGKEVSKFVKLKYLEVLKSLPAFQQGNYQEALRQSFHKIDELLEEEVIVVRMTTYYA